MPSDAQLDIMGQLGERADAIRSRRVRPEEDNMLKVCSDRRKAALDLRLLDQLMDVPARSAPPTGSPDYGPPTATTPTPAPAATRHPSAAASSSSSATSAPRRRLERLRRAPRPARPARHGRHQRPAPRHRLAPPGLPLAASRRRAAGRPHPAQGNHDPQVQVISYVTERSFDGYMWQAVERKTRFIAQVMRGKLDVREIEDIGDAALSCNEVKALATGTPLLMEKAEADADLTRLERAERAWNRNLDILTHKVNATNEQVTALHATAAGIDAAITRRRDTRGDAFTMTVGNARHSRRQDAGEHLRALITGQDQALTRSGHRRLTGPLGELGGFSVLVTIERVLASTYLVIEMQGAPAPRSG
jgi:hypothetical protein